MSRLPKLALLLPLLGLLALVGLFAVSLQRDPRALPSPLVDKPAPDFRVALLETDAPSAGPATLARNDLLGQVWLLNVWASWCTPCQVEHPLLMDIARTRQLPLVGMNYKDAPDAARAWLARHGNPYQATLSDPQGAASLDWGVYGVPETFLVDAQGVVRWRHAGPLTPEVLREQLLPLIRRLRA
jgi:cytochrome c biogenesis protein CcmG/thiol:disulfide interchange protein DsbE